MSLESGGGKNLEGIPDQKAREQEVIEVAYRLDKMLTASAEKLGISLDLAKREEIDRKLRELFGVGSNEKNVE